MLQQTQNIVNAIRERTDFLPKIALVLGSGLGDFADSMDVVCEIPYSELPDFPVSTAPGHAGRFIFGYVGGVPVVCMKGRIHYYEGYRMDQVVLPVRVLAALGVQFYFVTNACGGIKDTFHAGSFALINDHVSIFAPNPLIGPNDEEEGPRFPDMTTAYDLELRKLAHQVADEDGIPLDDGVYAQLTGPTFETPAEIRLLKTLGVDMTGMSTVPEVIVARHIGLRVIGISLISNLAAGISPTPLSSEEVNEAGAIAAPLFTKLVTDIISRMGEL